MDARMRSRLLPARREGVRPWLRVETEPLRDQDSTAAVVGSASRHEVARLRALLGLGLLLRSVLVGVCASKCGVGIGSAVVIAAIASIGFVRVLESAVKDVASRSIGLEVLEVGREKTIAQRAASASNSFVNGIENRQWGLTQA